MTEHIPLSIPSIGSEEKKYLEKCIDSTFVSTVGEYVGEFERKVADYVGAPYAVAMMNGTCALHIALLTSGVRPGDYVFVPDITFVATINSVSYAQAEPIIMDVDDSLGLCPKKLQEYLELNSYQKDGQCFHKKDDRRMRAILPVHIFGSPCSIKEIVEISEKYNLKVIEDAAESLGSFSEGKHTGTFGEVGCFSFNGNKILTTGSGGVLVTSSETIYKQAKHLSTTAKTDPINFVHDQVGFNYRMSNLHAALGMAQFNRFESFLETKKRNYQVYKEELKNLEEVKLLDIPSDANHWFYTLDLGVKKQLPKDEVLRRLIEKGIGARSVWTPMSQLEMYKSCQTSSLDVSTQAFRRLINLPCSVDLKEEQVRQVVTAVKEVITEW